MVGLTLPPPKAWTHFADRLLAEICLLRTQKLTPTIMMAAILAVTVVTRSKVAQHFLRGGLDWGSLALSSSAKSLRKADSWSSETCANVLKYSAMSVAVTDGERNYEETIHSGVRWPKKAQDKVKQSDVQKYTLSFFVSSRGRIRACKTYNNISE